MSRYIRFAITLLCFLGFLFIRFRESELFYDPLISFFKGYYQSADLPELHVGKLVLHLAFRYGIHMVLSLIILWVAFMEKGILKFALLLYGIAFILLISSMIYLLHTYEVGMAGQLFYVRRFLIQPLLIVILVPAFFYDRKVYS